MQAYSHKNNFCTNFEKKNLKTITEIIWIIFVIIVTELTFENIPVP